MTRRFERRLAALGMSAIAALGVAACGGSSDTSTGSASSSSSSSASGSASAAAATSQLALVGYSTPKKAYDALTAAFAQSPTGKGVGFSQSFGASGSQSRAVD